MDIPKKLQLAYAGILYPGKALGTHDTGFASIGRIDPGEIGPRFVYAQCIPHVNDWNPVLPFRTGKSENIRILKGFSEFIGAVSPNAHESWEKSFFMNKKNFMTIAMFWKGLQIFIRRKKKTLRPEIIFQSLTL